MKRPQIIFTTTIFLLSIFLGSTYFVFQNKVKKIQKTIQKTEKIAYDKNEILKTYWSKKYKSECTICGTFVYDKEKIQIIRDTVVSFFIYKKNINYNSFKECFFECAYHNNINGDKHDNFTVLATEKQIDKSKYFYVELEREICQKYNITKEEFSELITLGVGVKPSWRSEHLFIKEAITDKDIECLSCYNEYFTNHILNFVAINDFKDFVKQYITDKKGLKNSLRKYKFNSSELMRNMKRASNNIYTFHGKKDGIGIVNYSFNINDVYDINLKDPSIKNLVYEFGPLKFQYDDDQWHIITVGKKTPLFDDPEYQIYKIPLIEVYEKTFDWDTKYDRFLKSDNSYKIKSTSTINLENILSMNYNKNYSNEVSVEDIIFHNATEYNVNLSINLVNTLKKNINKMSFKVKIYTSPAGGELVSEDVISVNAEVGSNEMRTVKINYNPKSDFKEKLNFFGYDVKLLSYESNVSLP
tara:strand:+ start:1100 stop:2512 length:1413 start_codon:yes stop_codon:yes gene_type:complete